MLSKLSISVKVYLHLSNVVIFCQICGASACGQRMFDGGPSGCGLSGAVTSGSGGGPLVTDPAKGRAMLGRAMLRIARFGRSTWEGQYWEVKRRKQQQNVAPL